MASLTLKIDPKGPRHYLAGRPVDAGDLLELAIHPEAVVGDYPEPSPWVRVVYDGTADLDKPPRVALELGNGERNSREPQSAGVAVFDLPPGAVLRWPSD